MESHYLRRRVEDTASGPDRSQTGPVSVRSGIMAGITYANCLVYLHDDVINPARSEVI